MRKGLFILLSMSLFVAPYAMAASNFIPKRFNTVTSHDDVYPYRLNNAKTNSNKTTNSTGSVSSSPVGKRNVVRRKTNARVAAVNSVPKSTNPTVSERRVVQRSASQRSATNNTPMLRQSGGRNSSNMMTRSSNPIRNRTQNNIRITTADTTQSNEKVSAQRCMSDYKQCMEGYCQREDTAYNRCYCSAKLAQIDSKYQNKIDSLIQQIIKLQYDADADSDEIKEYWNQTVGVYTHTNPWVNIDNALNIEWADTQSRVRGQNAFNTGHQYCVQHLRACSYMATNMRDAYKSEIARDCNAYEQSLQKIQNAAESVIESYK